MTSYAQHLIALILLLSLAACGSGNGTSRNVADAGDLVSPKSDFADGISDSKTSFDTTLTFDIQPPPDLGDEGDLSVGPLDDIPLDPFEHDGFWYGLRSASFPFVIWYTRSGDLALARSVRQLVEHSWTVQVTEYGFPAPFPFDPTGNNELQVYLVRDQGTGVDGWDAVASPEVGWDAWQTIVTIDAWGEYGGENLAVTVAHEFSHLLHAANDWFESVMFFESSASYIQEKLYPDNDDYLYEIQEFQQYPHWPPDRQDDYETYYMYGASLYLFFLEQRYFPQDKTWLARVWKGSRNPPRPSVDGIPEPKTNDPDWLDALNAELPNNVRYTDTVVEFARWRYYVGDNDDGLHFHDAEWLGTDGMVPILATLNLAGPTYSGQGPMLLGTDYLTLQKPANGKLKLAFDGDAKVRWALQLVPALTSDSDGESVAPDGTVEFGPLSARTLVITALPPNGTEYDTDTRTDDRFGYQLTISAQ